MQFDEVRKSNRKLIDKWRDFITWIKSQQIETIIDFDSFVSAKYEVSNDNQYVKELANDSVQYFEVGEMRYRRNCCNKIDKIEIDNWRKYVAEMSPGR